MKPVAGLKMERAVMVSISCSKRAPLPGAAKQKGACQKSGLAGQYFRFYLPTFPQDTRSRTMRTSMNFLLWTTHVTAEHFPILAKLKRTGFDGVEIPVFEGDAAHFRTIR